MNQYAGLATLTGGARGRSPPQSVRRRTGAGRNETTGVRVGAVRPALTRDAQRLIDRHVHTTGTLDLLLLLRIRPTGTWSPDEICELLRCPPGWADDELRRLQAADLVVTDGDEYRYAPATPRQRMAVDSLAAAWRRDRAAVTRRILAATQRAFDG